MGLKLRVLFVIIIAASLALLAAWGISAALKGAPSSNPSLNANPNPAPPLTTPQKPGIATILGPVDPNFDRCQNIYKMVCQKTGETKDFTGSVSPDVEGERQALHLYENLINEHPDWNSEQVDDALVKIIFDDKHRSRIESAYRWVLKSIERFFDSQPETVFTAQEKKQIKARLKKTKLQLPPPASLYADEPDLLTKNEVYYERTPEGQMRLRVGGAFVFIAKSWFNIIFTMAHELAHSIDPCEIRSVRLSFPAYDRLTACFLSSDLIAIRKTRSECGDNDQLSETFADWVAVQVTADALALFSTEFRGPQIVNAARNSVRDLCDQDDDVSELDLDLHPSPSTRIEKIFGLNPKIRSLLGCGAYTETASPYCTFGL